MKIELSDEQKLLKDSFRAFVNSEIIPIAGIQDEKETIDADVMAKMAEEGYLGSMIPKEYGGKEWDMITLGILHEEIGRGCSSLRSLLTVHGMVALAISRWGSDEQKAKWLPKMASGEIIGAFGLTEPDIGSDAKSIKTSAIIDNNHYILNGHKKWTTMGQIAGLFLIFAQFENKPTAYLVESSSDGFSTQPITGLLGFKASMCSEIFLNNCKVPAENIISLSGTGLSHIALTCLDYGRYTVACGCVGLAQACLDDSINYTRQRKQFDQPLRKNQLIQKMITEMVVNIKAARQLCYYAGYLKDIADPDSIMETWTAKYFSSTMLDKITSDAVQIHGANGCSRQYNVERYYRDAKINSIIEGTTQMHEILIATNAFRII